MAAQIKFYDWPFSPFCMKVRGVLDYKGLVYERINPLGRAIFAIRRRGKVGKVPAVEIEGELFVDSTDIIYELERRFPEVPVIPASPRQRALNHALEDWSDESLYFIGLYYRWYETEGRKPVPQAFGKSLVGRATYHFYLARILKQLRGQGTLRKQPRHVRSDLERHLVAIHTLLDPGPFLLGDSPYLCDFALVGQLNYLARTPVGAEALKSHDTIEGFRKRMKDIGGPPAA